MKTLPSNPTSLIPFIELKNATPANVSELVRHAPRYLPNEWRRLVENTIGAIHQIPRVFNASAIPDLDLKDVEAYFGRSSSSKTYQGLNLYNRFRAGLERGHTYGMVFAQTQINATVQFERFGIALINRLKEVDGLCIANRSSATRGIVGKIEPGLLYLTFKIEEGAEHARVLSQSQIDHAVSHMLSEFRNSNAVQKRSIQDAARTGLELANHVEYTGGLTIALAR